jgi:diguanylate cyclase (GGDEF)-like protein
MRAIFSGRRFSLRKVLRWLVLACVLPATLVCTALAVSMYQLQRQQVQQNTLLMARSVLSDLEREIAVIESGMKVLATSDELASGDLRAFHKRARDALAPGIVYNYILTDAQGRQVLNSLLSFGSALPSTGTPAQIGRVFTERATVLTDLFIGPVTRKPALAMGVPVGAGDAVAYSLNIGLDPQRINTLLGRQPLPEGWLIAVLDGSGTIVGRSRDADRYLGQKAVPELLEAVHSQMLGTIESHTKEGIPVFSAFARSKTWGWAVVVGAPKSNLEGSILRRGVWVLLGVVCAMALGLWLARAISKRVVESVHLLNEAATKLIQGEPMHLPEMRMREADAVARAMVDAAAAMEKIRFFAEHDTLTELPNRMLFETVVNRDLVLAERHPSQSALLAVDLDHFKQVNDTLGHEAGDTVLRQAARRIQQAIRVTDMAARIGGDEFLVFLGETSQDGAMDTAKRIVEGLSAPYGNLSIPVSASVGIAMFPEHGATLRALSAAADAALYKAKHAGRNQAYMATEAADAHQGRSDNPSVNLPATRSP